MADERKPQPPEGHDGEKKTRRPSEELNQGEFAGTSSPPPEKNPFFNFSGELKDEPLTHTEGFQDWWESLAEETATRPRDVDPEPEAPEDEADETATELAGADQPQPAAEEAATEFAGDEEPQPAADETATEFAGGDETATEVFGVDEEQPGGETDQPPLEIPQELAGQPSGEVVIREAAQPPPTTTEEELPREEFTETDTDVLRAAESLSIAEQAEQPDSSPVSEPAVAPDPAPGTQPSPYRDELPIADDTCTDLIPIAQEEEPGEPSTQTREPFVHPQALRPEGEEPKGPATQTDVLRTGELAPVVPEEAKGPDTPTEDLQPASEEPKGPATQTDVLRTGELAPVEPEEPEEAKGPTTRTEDLQPAPEDAQAPSTRTDVARTGDLQPPAAAPARGDETMTEGVELFPEQPEEEVEPAEERKGPSTRTDVLRTGELPRPEPVRGDETMTEGVELTPSRPAEEVEPSDAVTETISPDAPGTASFHEQITDDLDEAGAAAPAQPAAIEFHAASTSDFDEPDAPTPVPVPVVSDEPAAAGGLSAPVPTRARHRRPRQASLAQKLAAGVAGAARSLKPARIFRRLRTEWPKKLSTAWKQSGKRTQTSLKVDKTFEWWRRTLLEIGALFAIVVPIELALSKGQVGAFGFHPHPYWLIVLPMAGARGVVAGLLSATVASILYAIGALQALGVSSLGEIFTFKTMTEPLLFYGVGFFAGELHDELALRYRKLERMLKEIQERNQRLRQERDVLSEANKQLERRIVDDSVQFGNLVVAATRIERAGANEAFEIGLDLVEEHCGAVASVLLVLSDGSLDLVSQRGWAEPEYGARLEAARGSEFVARALAEGASVNGFSDEETAARQGPLVVAPLFDGSGIVKAILCLDELPPSRLNESTITVFLGIAEWLSATLSRLKRGQQQEEEARPASDLGGLPPDVYLGTPDDLGERLRLELERCSRYGVPTSFLAIQATEWTDTSHDGNEVVDHFAATHFTGNLRPSDTLYRFGYPGCYLLVLAGTTVEGAEVVRTRLLRRVDYGNDRSIGPIEVTATGPDAEAPDLLSLVERVAKGFRDATELHLEGACPVHVPSNPAVDSADAFLRRLRMETSLAVRNSFHLHVVGITAARSEAVEPGLLSRHVQEAGLATLRPTDGVYAVGAHQCVVILPCTDSEEAATVAHRLVQAVRTRDPDAAYGNVETQVLGLGEPHTDVNSFLKALGKRGAGGKS